MCLLPIRYLYCILIGLYRMLDYALERFVIYGMSLLTYEPR